MKIKFLCAAFFVLIIFSGCGTGSRTLESSGTITVNYDDTRQIIDGFGGSNAWTRLPNDPYTAQRLVRLLYSRTDGMGFTILRNRIPFRERLAGDNTPSHNDGFLVRNNDNTYSYTVNEDGVKTFNLDWNSWDISSTRSLIRQIQNLGENGPERLVIMSAPWTPPNNRVTRWKEDVTNVSSRLNFAIDWSKPDIWGRLKRAHYNDYADLLGDYVKNFEPMMGHPLAILSVQNEPNWKADWESAYWSGTDLRDFIKIIAQRFPKKNITFSGDIYNSARLGNTIGIMMPEFENFNINFNEMIKPSLDDPESERIISHIALHQYNAPNDPSSRAGSMEFPDIIASGKRFWQTEVSGSGPHLPSGSGISNALFYARMIHWNMTLAQTNAFLFWWLWTNNRENDFPGALIRVDDDLIIAADRLYAMGQFSRFIRPGWRRIGISTPRITGLYSSAYKNPDTDEIAIVIINERITSSSVTLELQGAEFTNLEIWRTSEKEKLKQSGRQRVSGNISDVHLQERSITTFYGRVKK